MRTFSLIRDEDETGVSGVGRVAEGVQFGNGRVVLQWLTAVASVVYYDNIQAVYHIHGHGGKTRLIWCDDGSCD